MSANAYELLKSEIVSGKRKPGEIFEEKRFAAQLGVSRTPVREAVLAERFTQYNLQHPQRSNRNRNIKNSPDV